MTWWKPWTWHPISAVTFREPEFTRDEVAWLQASVAYDGSLNRFGIPRSEASDAANQFAYDADKVPTVDWAEHAVGAAQKAYYDADNKDHPMNRSGHMWGVHKRMTTD